MNSALFGQQALSRALKLFNRSIKDLTQSDWENVLNGGTLTAQTSMSK